MKIEDPNNVIPGFILITLYNPCNNDIFIFKI